MSVKLQTPCITRIIVSTLKPIDLLSIADAMSLGNGNFLQQGVNYFFGSLTTLPMNLWDPPANKNDSLKYKLYTQKNPDQPCILEPTQEAMQRCQIDPKAKLVMLLHGFIVELNPGNLFEVRLSFSENSYLLQQENVWLR